MRVSRNHTNNFLLFYHAVFAYNDSCAIIVCMNDQTDTSQKSERQKSNVFLGAGLALVLATASFFSGLHIGSGELDRVQAEAGLFSFFSSKTAPANDADLSEFWRVWNLLDQKFVTSTTTKTLTTQEKIEGAISGLVKSYGDPYTVFLPPEEAGMFEEDISGNFSGVGMEVGLREGVVTVIAPLPDTPASKAGVLPQDVIVKIDGKVTDGMNIDEAVRLIRGEAGTEVVLTIYREGELEFLTIPIVRDTIAIPTVKTSVEGDVFVISLYSFNALAEMRMQEALREYVTSGKRKLILDLRGNPGGFLQSSVSIASYFLPAGAPIVREGFGEGKDEEVYRSLGRDLREYAPEAMVVLVDGGSASASEILAGALQEHGVATLMGEQTYGKGSVQELISLPTGSSLKVTIARWFTPDGVSISEGGLTPDIVIERTPQQIIEGVDPQLEGAVKYLNGDTTVGSSTAETAQ